MSIFKTTMKLLPPKEPVKASEPMKFSLRRTESILDAYDIVLEEQTLSKDPLQLALTLSPAIAPEMRNYLVKRLQKRAIPKSEWKLLDEDTIYLYKNNKGKFLTTLVFERKK